MHGLRIVLQRQLSAAWHYRWQAVLFTWLVCAVGWAAVFAIPNQYESSARMYVDADAVLTPLLKGLAVDTSNSGQVDMLQRTLLSRPNLDKLISKTDLELELTTLADREALVDRLQTDIRITPQTRNLFTITYRNKRPRLAYDVVRTMLATFVESKTGTNRSEIENAGKFLTEQIASYEKQLRDAERRRADFRARYIDVLPPDGGGLSRLDAQNQLVRQLQGQLQDSLARRDTLNQGLSNTPAMVITETDPAVAAGGGGGGNQRLRDAERALSELRLKYTDNHPDVVAARNLVASIRSGGGRDDVRGAPSTPAVAARSRTASNPIYEQLKVRLVENDATIASLQRQIAEALKERDRFQDIARGAPGLQAEFENLNRDYSVLRKNYDDLTVRRESMRISNAADVEGDKVKVQIIDPPTIPQNPVAPKRILLITGVLAAGLGAGGALAFLLVQMDQSFHSTEDLRQLGFPVVGGVSMLAAAMPFSRRLLSVATFAMALAVPAIVYGGLMVRLLKPGGTI
ncbi:MAG: XrtA system polysaccharide chain length determinant [Janthinobacterium lividum]